MTGRGRFEKDFRKSGRLMAKDKRVFKQSDNVSFIEVDDGCILYYGDGMKAHSLNQSASFIWVLCDGRHTVDEIAAALKNAFGAEGLDVVKVVEDTVGEFLKENLVELL